MLDQWLRNMPDMPEMYGRELRPCRTFCPAGFNTHKISDKENKNDHDIYHSSTGKNVWQGLKMSGRVQGRVQG